MTHKISVVSDHDLYNSPSTTSIPTSTPYAFKSYAVRSARLIHVGQRARSNALKGNDVQIRPWRKKAVEPPEANYLAPEEVRAKTVVPQRCFVSRVLAICLDPLRQGRDRGAERFPAREDGGREGAEARQGQGRTAEGRIRSRSMMSARATGSSQYGQYPPAPTLRAKVLQSSQRWVPRYRFPQVSHS